MERAGTLGKAREVFMLEVRLEQEGAVILYNNKEVYNCPSPVAFGLLHGLKFLLEAHEECTYGKEKTVTFPATAEWKLLDLVPLGLYRGCHGLAAHVESEDRSRSWCLVAFNPEHPKDVLSYSQEALLGFYGEFVASVDEMYLFEEQLSQGLAEG